MTVPGEGFIAVGIQRIGQRIADADAVEIQLIQLDAQFQCAEVGNLAEQLSVVDLCARTWLPAC